MMLYTKCSKNMSSSINNQSRDDTVCATKAYVVTNVNVYMCGTHSRDGFIDKVNPKIREPTQKVKLPAQKFKSRNWLFKRLS